MTEVLSALGGTIIGIVGTYYFSLRLFNLQRKREAASEFRAAFAEEAAKCKSNGDFRIKEIIDGAIFKQEKAVIVYEPYVSKSEIHDFYSLWNKYCELNQYHNINDLTPETGFGNEGCIRELSEKEQRQNTLSYINELIKYAPVQ